MKILKSIMIAAAAVTLSGAASAATLTFTEGGRADIVGSTRVINDGNGASDTTGKPPGFDLTSGGALGYGDSVNLHGRIINIDDFYRFESDVSFSINWIFDGYDTGGVADAAAGESGFTSTPLGDAGDGSASFTLTNLATNTVVAGPAAFTTNVVLGDPLSIFGMRFDAGSYSLMIDGTGPLDALYDITISTVPLPAGGLLLLTALGGIGLARRRRC